MARWRASTGLFCLALMLALAWWSFGALLRPYHQFILIWNDQQATFTRANPLDPYQVAGFINPPWTSVLLAPLRLLEPLAQMLRLGYVELSVLLQWLMYALILAELIRRHTQKAPFALFIALSSPFALDNAIEFNIDWLVALGLLLPPSWSVPFLLSKPQLALGWVLGWRLPQQMRWLILSALLGLASVLVWGDWWQDWQANITDKQISLMMVNAAPSAALGTLPAGIIGLGLALWAWRRKDGLLGMLAVMFFAPYLARYSLLLPFSLLAARYPRLALLISLVLWLMILSLFIASPLL